MSLLLEVKNLRTYFHTLSGTVKAVDDISYHINTGEIVGLVGESGCGKSVSQRSVMQLIPTPPGEIVGGEVLFDGQNLLNFKAESKAMRAIRGGKIAMIYQEPMTSLNPVLTIAEQLIETQVLHLKIDRHSAMGKSIELLEKLGIPDAASRIKNYPHQFSGGMRQRVMTAMALSCNPQMIIADEPTTALDVTTQAQLLELITKVVREYNTSLVIVTHNLGVVARYVDRVYVMYAGKIIESGTSEDIFIRPAHPYTIGLINSVPSLNEKKGRKLVPIFGTPPDLINMPPSCAFRPRCSYREQCKGEKYPPERKISGEHYVCCHFDFRGETK
jgi:oligopeptide/dipeptide ABC transporter ATP-binding protein